MTGMHVEDFEFAFAVEVPHELCLRKPLLRLRPCDCLQPLDHGIDFAFVDGQQRMLWSTAREAFGGLSKFLWHKTDPLQARRRQHVLLSDVVKAAPFVNRQYLETKRIAISNTQNAKIGLVTQRDKSPCWQIWVAAAGHNCKSVLAVFDQFGRYQPLEYSCLLNYQNGVLAIGDPIGTLWVSNEHRALALINN